MGCVSKNTQKKWDLLGLLGQSMEYELHSNEAILNKKTILTLQWKQNLELY